LIIHSRDVVVATKCGAKFDDFVVHTFFIRHTGAPYTVISEITKLEWSEFA